MRLKYGKFYARWRDENRIEHRKAFSSAKDAKRFEQRQKDEVRARKLKGANTVSRLAIAWMESHSRFQDHRDRFFSRLCTKEMVRLAGDQNVAELSYMVPNGLIQEWSHKPFGRAKRYAAATLFGLRFRLKNLLAYLVDHGGSPELTKRLEKVPIPQARQIIAEAWEVEALKASAPPWMKCFILFCLDGGLRTAEALRICPANYSAGNVQFVIEVKKRRIKNFLASEELQAVLATAPQSSDPTVPYVTLLRGENVRDKTIYSFFRKLLEQIGSKSRLVQHGDHATETWLHPHDLRRTIATWMYWKTKNLRQVQEYLGHAHAITTLRYIVHADSKEILPIIEDLKIERRQEAVMQFARRKGAGS